MPAQTVLDIPTPHVYSLCCFTLLHPLEMNVHIPTHPDKNQCDVKHDDHTEKEQKALFLFHSA